jgi:predicted polyphosphate/ATP-dependent NAD kinase
LRKVGLLVNPIAGMGGSVGLKGTDGPNALSNALSRGAKPSAGDRAKTALGEMKNLKEIQFLTGSGEMGETILKGFNLSIPVITINHTAVKQPLSTSAEDTVRIAREMVKQKVELLLFCGGDGTARDLLAAVQEAIPVIGIPAGVKMHSAVFAITPQSAGKLARDFLEGGLELHEAEVMDVDEEAYREGRLAVKLYGFLLVPQEPFLIQSAKAVLPETVDEHENVEAIARQIVEEMNPETTYILGAGTTVKAIADQLGEPKTLLGIDVYRNRHRILADAQAKDLDSIIEKEEDIKIIISPIGQQGHIFGRGTQPITPEILRRVGRENVIIIASQAKIAQLKSLYVDTGDADFDASFRGYVKVIIDYRLWRMVEVR